MTAPSLILSQITRLVSPTVLLFSLWLLASGHNAPGGGFIGGLVACAGVVLAYATGGVAQVRRLVPVRGELILGVGLATAQLTAMAAWVWGGGILASRLFDLHLPVLGDVHLVTPLFFDIGVYVVVLGLVTKILTTLGDPEAPADAKADDPAGAHDPAAVAADPTAGSRSEEGGRR